MSVQVKVVNVCMYMCVVYIQRVYVYKSMCAVYECVFECACICVVCVSVCLNMCVSM